MSVVLADSDWDQPIIDLTSADGTPCRSKKNATYIAVLAILQMRRKEERDERDAREEEIRKIPSLRNPTTSINAPYKLAALYK